MVGSKMQRLPSSFKEQYPEAARRLIRRSVYIEVQISGSDLPRQMAYITDLNTLGCQVEVRCKFNVGQRMMITIPTFLPLGGHVAWYEWSRVGFEFDNPLAEAVLPNVLALSRDPVSEPRRLQDL